MRSSESLLICETKTKPVRLSHPGGQSYFLSFSSLSIFVATLRSGFCSLLGILIVSLFLPTSLKAQNDTLSIDTIKSSTRTIYHSSEIVDEATTIPKIKDSLNFLSPEQKKKRTWIVTGANVVGYGGIMTALASAWYKKYTRTKLHSFDDSREWLQMDKTGHYYGTWIESRANNELWKWAGMERKKRIWISGLTSFTFQGMIEYLDGKSEEWGFSWSDFGANALGSATFIAQELAWDEQRIKLKWSFHRKNYTDPSLNKRSDELFGKTTPERILKDYNGQTYWASANLKPFFKNSNLPSWLAVAIGYGAEGMFGGTENVGKDDNGNITFNRPDIKRYRQWYLAPDIDLSEIKTNKKGLKFLFKVLSAFKFPMPSLEFSDGKFKLHAIHF